MPRLSILSSICLVLPLLMGAGRATANPLDLTVTFAVSGEPGNFQYDFTVRNDSDDPIEVYSVAITAPDLNVVASPAGWAQGPFSPVQWCTGGDCFGTGGGIAPGASLSGFVADSTSMQPLSEVPWTVAIVGPTIASLELPITSGDTAQFSGNGFALGATGKRRFEIIKPPGATLVQTFGLNDLGQITGIAEDETGYYSYIFDLESCAYTNIGTGFSAIDINNAGVIVGNTNEGLCAMRDEQGNISTFTPFEPPLENTFCTARGNNEDGTVAGYTVDANGTWGGFVYDPVLETFDLFLPSPQTFAHGVNADDVVLGSVFLDEGQAFPGSVAGRYGYRRDSAGAVKYFSIAQAAPGFTRGRGVSDSGLISGFYSDPVAGETKSFVTTLGAGTAYEEISLSDAEIVYQKPCNPNVPPPPSPAYELFSDTLASHVRDDGVVVGNCQDAYYDESTGDVIWHLTGFVATPVVDSDSDTVVDRIDNCVEVANPDQRDTDGDNIGSICDADFTNDCVINFLDLGVMKAAFFSSNDNVDLNGDGAVNFFDLGILKASLFAAPGPSGLDNECD